MFFPYNFGHDIWEDCENDFEVRKRDWMWLTIRQVIDFKLDIDVTSVDDDEVSLVYPLYYEKIELLDLPPIDWSVLELKILKERTAYVLKKIRDWVSKIRSEKVTGEF